MEAAKTKDVRNLLIIISMLRGFEEAEAVQIQRCEAENPEVAGFAHLCYSMQASPNIREAWRSAAVANDFRHRWIDQLQMEVAETEVPLSWTEEAMTRSQAGARILKTEDRSRRSDQAHARVTWSTRAARQLLVAIWRDRLSNFCRRKKQKKQGKGTLPYLTGCTLTKASAEMDAKPRFDLKAPTSKKCT